VSGRRILLAEAVAAVCHGEATVGSSRKLDVVAYVTRGPVEIRDELLGRVVLLGRIFRVALPELLHGS